MGLVKAEQTALVSWDAIAVCPKARFEAIKWMTTKGFMAEEGKIYIGAKAARAT